MIELLWIKSLFNFAIIILAALLGSHFYGKERSESYTLVLFFVILVFSQILELANNIIWLRELVNYSRSLLHFDFALHMTLGPLLWLYLLQKSLDKKQVAHFLPAIVTGCFSPIAQDFSNSVFFGFFLISQVHFMIYIVIAFVQIMGNTKRNQAHLLVILVLSRLLRVVEFLLWQTFDLIGEPTAWIMYIIAESLFVFVLIALVFRIFSRKSLFEKSTVDDLPDNVLAVLNAELVNYLSREDVFSDPLLTVKKVAEHFKIGPYYVSRYINTKLQQSFLDIINGYRITFCEEKLRNPAFRNLSIKDVYYSAGFNSKSVFNTAFKKRTGLTPSEFRKQGA